MRGPMNAQSELRLEIVTCSKSHPDQPSIWFTHTKKTMRRLILLTLLAISPALFAGPTNSILFVTQVPIPADFTTIGSVFGNHRSQADICGRGGDLYILYANGTIKNLTRAAGFGAYGPQHHNGLARRQP